MRGRPRRKGEMLRLGVGKGREVESLRKGERERERRRGECNTTVSVLMFAAISSTVRCTPGGLMPRALQHSIALTAYCGCVHSPTLNPHIWLYLLCIVICVHRPTALLG